MRLYLFRSTPDIGIEDLEKVANKINQVFGIDYSIFTGSASGVVEQISMKHLLQISDQFLERGEPVVALAFTREGVGDVDILGQGSQLDRGAWVKWNDKIQQITITALHELGHICDADHCINESCTMFHTYREHKGNSLSTLFCEKCRANIQNSWVYNRLTQASEDRAKKQQRLPKIVKSTPLRLTPSAPIHGTQTTPIDRPSSYPSTPPFPDWSLASRDREEFVRRAMEHFGYRRR
jgi:hypothetical protein